MKINIAFTQAGTQKQLDISDELKLRPFYDKRISHEVPADSLGPEWKGYVLKITGGFDKCGTPMMQGVLTNGRVSLLLSKGQKGVKIKRDGVRYRKSVRGCILDSNLSVINAIIVKKGKKEIPGLTDTSIPVRLGPKRADKIRKIFKLSPKDDVRKYVVHRKVVYKDEAKRKSAEEAGKEFRRAPKIQRLVTFQTKRRTHLLLKEKQQRSQKSREQAENYAKLVGKLKHDYKVSHEEHRKRKSSTSSKKPDTKASALIKDDKKQEAKKKVVSHVDSKKIAAKQAQIKGKAPEKISTDGKKVEKKKTVETKPAAIRKKIEKAKDTATPKASSSIKFESKPKVKETTAPKSGSISTKPKAKQAPAPKASSSIKFETAPKEKSSASQTKPKTASQTKTEAKPSATSAQKPTVKSVEKTKPVKK